jgi:hypothetical protein
LGENGLKLRVKDVLPSRPIVNTPAGSVEPESTELSVQGDDAAFAPPPFAEADGDGLDPGVHPANKAPAVNIAISGRARRVRVLGLMIYLLFECMDSFDCMDSAASGQPYEPASSRNQCKVTRVTKIYINS